MTENLIHLLALFFFFVVMFYCIDGFWDDVAIKDRKIMRIVGTVLATFAVSIPVGIWHYLMDYHLTHGNYVLSGFMILCSTTIIIDKSEILCQN